MDALLVALRLLLAGVFVTAAMGKLLDPAGSRTAMREFKVPERLQVVAAITLPVTELAVAAALILRPSARWGGAGAMILLLAFVGGITAALRRGQAPDCHCFGQLHSEPAGKSTLVRNGVLLLLATLVLALGPGPAIDDWVGARSAGELLAGAASVLAVAGAAWAWPRWSRKRAFARMVAEWEKPAGLPIGAAAPHFELIDLDGSSVTLETLTASGLPAMLFFTHPECEPCSRLLPKLAYWQEALGERLTIAVLSQGGAEANAPLKAELELSNVLLERRSEVYESYRIRGTPSAVVVSPDGNIASDTGTGEFVIEEVLRLGVHRSGIAATVAA